MTFRNKKLSLIWSIIWVLIFLFALAMNFFVVFERIGQDEGVFLTIAKGLHYGHLPYKDFFDHKPPGIYFFLNLIGHFSSNPIIYRVIYFGVNLLTAFLIAITANKIRPKSGIHGAVLYLSVLPFFQANRIIAEPLLALLITTSLYIVLLKRDLYIKYSILLGTISFLFCLVKQPGLINALILFVFLLSQRKARNILGFLCGALIPLLLLLIWLNFNNASYDFYNQAIIYNIAHYPRENIGFVMQNIGRLIYHTFPIWVLSIVGVSVLIKDPRLNISKKILILSLLLLPLPFFLGRHYEHYWLQILPIMGILAGVAMRHILKAKSLLGRSIITIFFVVMLSNNFGNFKYFLWQYQNKYLPAGRETKDVETYLKKADNPILTENQFTFFYYLSPQKPLNKYLYITEVNDWSEESEAKTLEDLRKHPDTTILWPNDPQFAYAKNLQQYILSVYKKEKSFGSLGLDIYTIR